MSYSVEEAIEDGSVRLKFLKALAQYDPEALRRNGRWYSRKLSSSECDRFVVVDGEVELYREFAGGMLFLPQWPAPTPEALIWKLSNDPEASELVLRILRGQRLT